MEGSVSAKGELKLKVIKRQVVPGRRLTMWEVLKYGLPHFGLSKEVAFYRLRNLPNLWRGIRRLILARLFRLPHFTGALSLTIIRGNGRVVDLGLASLQEVTDNGVNYIRDCFLGIQEAEDMNFHGFGTDATAEDQTQTALIAELTTQYAVNSTRPTGTPVSGGAGAYRTTATLSPDANVTIAEHGIFDQAGAPGGVLLDRSQFAGVALVGGADSLQSQFTISFVAGG